MATLGRLSRCRWRQARPGAAAEVDRCRAGTGCVGALPWTRAHCTAAPRAAVPDDDAPLLHAACGIWRRGHPIPIVSARLATPGPVAVIDNDRAGRTWRDSLTALLADAGQTLTILEPPAPGLDLNAWSLKDSEWTAALRASAIDSLVL